MQQRIGEAKFLNWMSDDSLSDDFKLLRMFINEKSNDYSNFFNLFLNPNQKYLLQKTLTKVGNHNSLVKLTLNKTISAILKLKNEETHLSRSKFIDFIQSYFAIPELLATTLMCMIQPKNAGIPQEKQRVRFSSVQKFFAKHFLNKTIDDVLIFLITGSTDTEYVVFEQLPVFLYECLDKYHKKDLTNDKLYSSFIDYVIVKLFIVFDVENKGRIDRKCLTMDSFIKALEAVSIPEHFLVVYKIYKELGAGKKSAITIDDLCRYDKRRICRPVVERFLTVINTPTKKGYTAPATDKVSFVTFVYYITMLEDKGSISALNVWFRVCDDDCDGLISVAEMEELYNMQIKEIKEMGSGEYDTFEMVLPRIMDMINTSKSSLSRSDIRKSNKWQYFFNMLLDPKIFDDYDLSDPLLSYVESVQVNTSLWDDFIASKMSSY